MPEEPKRRLGRGLSSLMRTQEVQQKNSGEKQENVEAPSGAAEIDVKLISPNPHQPRRDFDKTQLDELSKSIAQDGILQPLILVKGQKGKYVLIAGERRLRAAKLARLKTVPAVIKEATQQQMTEWAVIENIQRADLNPMERASAYRDVMDQFKLTQQQVAERMGQPRGTVANYLRLHDLCDELQKMTAEGALSFGHAKVLAGLAGQEKRQQKLARMVVANGLSVRKLESLVDDDGTKEKPASKPGKSKPAYVRDIEHQLTERIGTRVSINQGRSKNTGKIVVEYYNLDDFDRISQALGLQIDS